MAYRTRRFVTSGGKQYVPDGRPGYHSPFAHQLLEALRSNGGSDGILSFEELLGYLERVSPQPRTGELSTNEAGSSFLFVSRHAELKPTPVKAAFGDLTVELFPANAEVSLRKLRVVEGSDSTVGPLSVRSGVHQFRVVPGAYAMMVTAAGYEPVSREIVVREGPQTETVRLVRQ
ncbi:MAG: hypothetical protein O3A46_00185 [Candidatus Poribacteria bacterium]|nr:hypothetical protein [Candidatus Poribacteria bacterium]